jgi:hypothetical protein
VSRGLIFQEQVLNEKGKGLRGRARVVIPLNDSSEAPDYLTSIGLCERMISILYGVKMRYLETDGTKLVKTMRGTPIDLTSQALYNCNFRRILVYLVAQTL